MQARHANLTYNWINTIKLPRTFIHPSHLKLCLKLLYHHFLWTNFQLWRHLSTVIQYSNLYYVRCIALKRNTWLFAPLPSKAQCKFLKCNLSKETYQCLMLCKVLAWKTAELNTCAADTLSFWYRSEEKSAQVLKSYFGLASPTSYTASFNTYREGWYHRLSQMPRCHLCWQN